MNANVMFKINLIRMY